MSYFIVPGTIELRLASEGEPTPTGWEIYTGPLVYGDDGITLYMTPQAAPPYLVEWTAQEKADYILVHGGDSSLTRRRVARELLQSTNPAIVLLRAFLRAYAQREGLTREQVLAALDAEIDAEA